MANELLEPALEIAPALMGQECWYVSTGGAAGTTFQLALGGKIPRTYPLNNLSHSELFRRFEGEVGLLVWCAWRLDGPDGPVTSSDDTDPSVEAGLSQLIGARIRTVDLRPRSWDLDLAFSNGLDLRVFCDHVPGDPSFGENWSLYTPRLIYTFGPGNLCSTEAVADPA